MSFLESLFSSQCCASRPDKSMTNIITKPTSKLTPREAHGPKRSPQKPGIMAPPPSDDTSRAARPLQQKMDRYEDALEGRMKLDGTLRQLFEMFDLAGFGTLTENEFFEVCRVLYEKKGGWTRKQNREAWIMSRSDIDGDQSGITQSEFLTFCGQGLDDSRDSNHAAELIQAGKVVSAEAEQRHKQLEERMDRIEDIIREHFDLEDEPPLTLTMFKELGSALNNGHWTDEDEAEAQRLASQEDDMISLNVWLKVQHCQVYDMLDEEFESGLREWHCRFDVAAEEILLVM